MSYTGRCVSVAYSGGREPSKYSFSEPDDYQYLTGQGWHFSLENGKSYYIAEGLFDGQSVFDSDDLCQLASKEITIRCLPVTRYFPHCNLIVSLTSGDTEYLNSHAAYLYLTDCNQSGAKSTITIFSIVFIFLFGVALFVIFFDLDAYHMKKKKEKQKQEKMQRLREEGKLHPKKQQQRKRKNAPANQKRN